MNDPLAKAKALEDLALGEKRRVFARLQAEAPDVADFVTEISRAFGKPVATAIRFRGGDYFEFGQFRKAQDYPDFQCPKPLWQKRQPS